MLCKLGRGLPQVPGTPDPWKGQGVCKEQLVPPTPSSGYTDIKEAGLTWEPQVLRCAPLTCTALQQPGVDPPSSQSPPDYLAPYSKVYGEAKLSQ